MIGHRPPEGLYGLGPSYPPMSPILAVMKLLVKDTFTVICLPDLTGKITGNGPYPFSTIAITCFIKVESNLFRHFSAPVFQGVSFIFLDGSRASPASFLISC